MGISEGSYQFSAKHPLHGPGQGARNVSCKWTSKSSVGMDVLEQNQRGATFVDPEESKINSRNIDTFVDDAAICADKVIEVLESYASEEGQKK
jgi:hypothetical protein